jgi:hypothetical protein
MPYKIHFLMSGDFGGVDGDSAKVGWIFGQSLKEAAQPLEKKGSMSGVLLGILEELVPVRV